MAIGRRIKAYAFILAGVFLLIFCWKGFKQAEAAEPPPSGILHPADKHGRHCWQVGKFRIFFNTSGEHAPPLLDSNGNSVPDFIENVGIQLTAAHYVFCTLTGLPDPLLSARYPKAEYIDVRIFSRKKTRNAQGLAFDEPSPSHDHNTMQSLVIYIANDINVHNNVTPAHEYFHQIQNGVSYFKNPWYYEGLAVWSEDVFLKRQKRHSEKSQLLNKLNSPEWLERLWASSYKAGRTFWIPMVAALGEEKDLRDDLFIQHCTYVDGTPVFADYSLLGGNVVRTFFTCLSEKNIKAINEYQYMQWSETNQRHPQNNELLMEAIRQTFEHY